VNSTLNSVFNLVYDNSTMKPTYSASSGFITPATSTTDVCSISGSATKTVKVRRIIVAATGGTLSVIEPLAIIKRSTTYTVASGGVAMVQVPYDSTNSLTGSTTNAGTAALVEAWTVNPTVGTTIGALADVSFYIGVGGTNAPAPGHTETFTFGTLGSPVVLRGVAQNIGVNFNGNTILGTVSCTFEWTEE
jgi:hypothetical protein